MTDLERAIFAIVNMEFMPSLAALAKHVDLHEFDQERVRQTLFNMLAEGYLAETPRGVMLTQCGVDSFIRMGVPLDRRAGDPVTPIALNQLGQTILEINRANGWEVTTTGDWCEDEQGVNVAHRRLATIIALIHSEASEALEAIRKEDYANFQEELADVIIRVLDCAAGLGIDMDAAVMAKLEKNRGRGYRHGGKAI